VKAKISFKELKISALDTSSYGASEKPSINKSIYVDCKFLLNVSGFSPEINIAVFRS
jgi:hypothetical protein